jgi:predicted nucleotidyltransferase
VYLFGSFAEGREHAESDVDLGFLLDRTVYPTEKERFDVRVDASSRLIDLLERGMPASSSTRQEQTRVSRAQRAGTAQACPASSGDR